MDLVEQRGGSNSVHAIDISQDHGLLVIAKLPIAALPFHLTLYALKALVHAIGWRAV